MSRRVCFLGVGGNPLEKEQIKRLPEDVEVWAVNEAHWALPEGRRADRVFQLHVRDWRESERAYQYSNGKRLPPGLNRNCFGRNKAHVEYLRTCGVPVYAQKQWDDIPTCVVYPFDEVLAAVGIPLPPNGERRVWATSSFGYMAALVLTEHFQGERVSEWLLYGVELPTGTTRERLWEWPNLAYYLGLATGLGIKIVLPETGSSLLSAPYYALDGHPYPYEADHWWVPGQAAVINDGESYRLGTYGQNSPVLVSTELQASKNGAGITV